MEYHVTVLRRVFTVNRIVTVHYFEYEKDYFFAGERHDFWEMVYVDKGEVEIDMGPRRLRLEQGYAAFHQPGEYHDLRANGVVAPNLVIVSFQCQSPAMEFFKERILALSDGEKHLLAAIVKETVQAFSSRIEDTFLSRLTRRPEPLFGAEQMISISLEQLLISLYRSYGDSRPNSTALKRGLERDVAGDALTYLREHIREKLSFDQIADAVGVSGTGLKTSFKAREGCGVMTFFARMKVDLAKTLIREGNLNISQISAYLGYDSIHLFSRRFKQITGMSPTEYGRSVKVELDEIWP